MFNAGLQVPVIPLLDVVGKAESASLEQMSATELNVGVKIGFTLMVKVVVEAHCPPLGVKV